MKSLSRTALLTFIIIFSSKLLGFFREIFLAYKYGTSYINDAYAICVSLPAMLFALFASGFARSYIPVNARVEEDKKRKFFSNTVTILFLFSIVVTVACIIFDKQIVSLLAPGFDTRTKKLTESFIDIVAWYLPIYVIFNILCANAQAKEAFVVTSFCDYIIVNIVLIIAIGLSDSQHLNIMVGGYVISILLATLILAIYSKKKLSLEYRFVFEPRDHDFRLLVSLAVPIGFSVMANQLNCSIDRMFASMLGVGITSALEYANRLQSLFLTLTTSVFISVCFPRINKCFLNRDIPGGVYYIKKACNMTNFFAFPFMTFIICYAEPIVRTLFERGAFDTSSTKITSECLLFYAIGIPFYAFREVETKALVANMKQKSILRNTVITVAINIGLNIMFCKMLRHVGLALATSMSGIFCSVMMYRDLKEMKIIEKEEFKETIKVVVSSIISSVFSFLVYQLLLSYHVETKIAFVFATFLFGVIYVLVCLAIKVQIVFWGLETLLKSKSR